MKTNLGHLDTAAGVAGLIKTVLALSHRQLPPSLHFTQPNPQIDFSHSPFFVNAELRDWPPGLTPRRAGVSSFGIGGTNAHLVLEEAPESEPGAAPRRSAHLLVLSARSEAALDQMASRLAQHLEEEPNPGLIGQSEQKAEPEQSIADVAYTLQVGRKAWPHRAALVCRSASEAAEALRRGTGLVRAAAPVGQRARVVFMFPGQGAQYVGMGRELYEQEPNFRHAFGECAQALRKAPGGIELRDVLFPQKDGEAEAEAWLRQTEVTQPALFAIEYGLARMWQGWGVEPWAMIGHSVGEYVAAVLSGVMSMAEGVRLVAARGRLMQRVEPGAMLAVALSEAELRERIGRRGNEGVLDVAAVNAPGLCTASGPESQVWKLEDELAAEGVWSRRLRTSHAFHSSMMEPVLDEYEAEVRQVQLRAPQVSYASNVTGQWVTAAEATDTRYWVRHLREPVRFWEGLKLILSGGVATLLLEMGPGESLSKLARLQVGEMGKSGAAVEHRVVATLGRAAEGGESEVGAVMRAVGELWAAGVEVAWEKLHEGERRRRVELPTYPFERQHYWVDAARPAGVPQTPVPKKKELDDWFYVPVWKQSVEPLAVGLTDFSADKTDWLIFADEVGLGDALAEQLRGAGLNPVTVRHDVKFARRGDTEYAVRAGEREDYAALLEELNGKNFKPVRIIHLWSVTGEASAVTPRDVSRRAQELGFNSLLLLAQALGDLTLGTALSNPGEAESIDIVVVSDKLQKVTGEDETEPAKATLLGPCLVLPLEYPNLTCRNIDIAVVRKFDGAGDNLVSRLMAEIVDGSAGDAVAYRGEHRWVQTFEPVRLSADMKRPLGLREEGVYLITGGLGGIGLTLAEYLARTVRARLVLVGRTGLADGTRGDESSGRNGEPDEVSRRNETLKVLEALGSEVLVLQADVTDEQQMRAAADRARERFGEINGVIHAAGVAPEGLAQLKTREAAERVLAPKVTGTQVLDSVFRQTALDFMVLCSSLRSVAPGPGTIDYCAANAFLDAFARARNSPRHGTRVLSINWDGWGEVGMSVREGEVPGGGADGVGAWMSRTDGMESFGRVLRTTFPQVLISTQDLPSVVERSRAFSAASTLERLAQARSIKQAHVRPDLVSPYVAPRDEKEQLLADIWQSLLGIERVGIHDNFFELGGDSVINLQIIAKVNQAGLNLTARQVFEYQTIAELAPTAGRTPKVEAEQGAVTGPVPLTPIQHWFFAQPVPHPHHWNQSNLMEVPGKLDPSLLKEAVRHLLRHHDALRLRFEQSETGWKQICVAPDEQVPFESMSFGSVPEEEQGRAVEEAAAKLQSSLDLSGGPLMRVALFDLGSDRPARLLLVIHHLAVDAVSWRVLFEDLYTAYQQLEHGRAVEWPPKTTSFQQWSRRLVEYAQSEPLRREAGYWLSTAEAPLTSLPVDLNGGRNTVASARQVTVVLTYEETQELLREVPKAYNTQINDVLLTALALTLARWTGNETLLLEMEGHGREALFQEVNLSRTVGWFTSLFPVLLKLEQTDDEVAALRAVKEQLRRIPNRGVGFGVLKYLCEDAEVARGLGALPRAEVIFLYLGQYGQEQGVGAAPFSPATESAGENQSPEGERSHLLECTAQVVGGRLSLSLGYSENIHHAGTVERLADEVASTLRSLIEQRHSSAAYTPSDFPETGLNQSDLDEILAELSELEVG